MSQPPDDSIFQFLAHPVKGASIVFAIFFAASFVLHVQQSRRYKCWPYTWPLPCACIIIIAAFICREYTAWHELPDKNASAIEGLFYSATLTFTLPLYVFLVRFLATPPKAIHVRPSYFFCIINCFNTAVITCISQGAATYYSLVVSRGSVHSGLALIKAGLILQLFLNAAFIGVLALFQHRRNARYMPQHHPRDKSAAILTPIFYVLIGLIVVCNVFRTIQIFSKPSSAIWTQEVYFWVFDPCVMLAFTLIFHVFHPAKYLLVEETCGPVD